LIARIPDYGFGEGFAASRQILLNRRRPARVASVCAAAKPATINARAAQSISRDRISRSLLRTSHLLMTTAVADETSLAYLGQWDRLVSTTNWEKGRIIREWRQALVAAAAPASDYSDDAWSQRVGNVTAQHVGRLRRVYERFDGLRGQITALYWSHFQAALDWQDAEMWLEGAAQSGWSVAEMRRQRWETLGVIEADRPALEEPATDAIDEDFDPADARESSVAAAARDSSASRSDHPDETDEESRSQQKRASDEAPSNADDAAEMREQEPQRPFAHLAEMPDDLGEAFEAFKLAIIRHKFAGWQEISRDDILAAIDALRDFALAPTE
jgi:hypothetical protein